MTDRNKDRWPKHVRFGRLVIALFNYWIGFSCRNIKIAKVADAGYIKFWWSAR